MIDVYDPPDVESIALSDLHLGRSDIEMVSDFTEVWIPRVRQKILLLGDIIDLQVAGTKLSMSDGSRFAWQVFATKQLMCRVIYVAGNHDERLGEILDSSGDVTILDGGKIHQITRNLYVTHGHQYDRANKYLFRPLDRLNFLGAKWLSNIYRKFDKSAGGKDIPQFRNRVLEDLQKLGVGATLIHGHTHLQYDYGTDGECRRAIDLGSAVSPPDRITFAAKKFRTARWELCTWRKRG